MPERKCDFPIVVKSSKGRASCPDRFFRLYKLNGNCQICPKVSTNRLQASDFLNKGEIEAVRLRRELKEEVSSLTKGF